KIEPRSLTGDDFTPDFVIASQLWNRATNDGFRHEAIGMHRVDAHPSSADSNDFPGVEKPPAFFIATRDIHYAAGFLAAHHAAGICAVCRDDFTVGQAYVGEKTLVALDKGSSDQT